jgi:O-antigen/teichoic acid export membrane protein
MVSEAMESIPTPVTEKRGTFFRQSGWLMIATTAGGAMMFAVHMIAQRMPKDEYGVFTTLLQIVTLMGIPAVGLQSVFAQQAAASLNPHHERELAGVFRGVMRATLVLWLLIAVLVFLFRHQILTALKIANPAALWITVLTGLIVLWRPLVQGVLQGRQNFLWLGGLLLADGVGRFLAVAVIIGLLGHYAAGGVVAVLIGSLTVFVAGLWFCRDCFRGAMLPVNWSGWLRRVVPLTFGMGVGIFMLAADMIFVQWLFPKEQTGYYAAAGMIGRALVYFTMPVAAVMFPKLARSAATGQKSNALLLALGFTALAGAGAALMCTFFPELPLRLARYDSSYLEISAPLVPWFGWCMLPLTLAMVLLNSLMAQLQFRAVPWMLAIAVGYGLTLYLRHDSFVQVIQTIGCFGLALLAVCAFFTFRTSARSVAPSESA